MTDVPIVSAKHFVRVWNGAVNWMTHVSGVYFYYYTDMNLKYGRKENFF